MIVAHDGQPCDPHEPADGRILLSPAMRADVMLDMQGEPGTTYRVIDDFFDRLSYTLIHLTYDAAPPVRAHPLDAPVRLPANPVPRPDLSAAIIHEVRLQGGMMSGMGNGGMMGQGSMMGSGAAWAINGQSMTGDGNPDMPPLFHIDRGRSCILDFRNETAWWHPMHLHGHSFNVLTRDGMPVPHDEWGDTVLVRPRERVRVAFVADNPGDWMLLNHSLNKSLMFFGAGSMMRRYNTKDIREITAVGRNFPVLGALWLAGAVAITGAPPFGLFASEFVILRAGFRSSAAWAALIMLMLLIVIFIGFLNHFRLMYFEPADQERSAPESVSAWCVLPMWLALLPLLVLGLWWPQEIWNYFGTIAQSLGGGALAVAGSP